MKKYKITYTTNIVRLFPKIVPYVIIVIIALISIGAAWYNSLLHGWGKFGFMIATVLNLFVLGGIYYASIRLSRFIVESLSRAGKKCFASDMMRSIHEGYTTHTLSSSTSSEVKAFLRDAGKDELTDSEKRYLQNEAEVERLEEERQRAANEMKQKKIAVIMEYTRLLFCGRIENYPTLEKSLERFLRIGDVAVDSDKYVLIGKYKKADIRVFCSNICAYYEITGEAMAKFQKIVFAKVFDTAKIVSLASNNTKSNASKLAKVTDQMTLTDIVEELKSQEKERTEL